MIVLAIVVLVIVFAIFAVVIYAIRSDKEVDLRVRKKGPRVDQAFRMKIDD